MSDPIPCTICMDKEGETRHLPLYVMGSEGIHVCEQCAISLTNAAQSMMSVASKARKAGFKAGKRVQELKSGHV